MIDLKKDWVKGLIFVVLLAGSLALIYVQIINAGTATKIESTLFSAIQFVLSVGFTWVLAQVVFENSEQEKQKKFAVGAFRRIKEIERNIVRTYAHVCSSLERNEDKGTSLEVVKANLLNAQDTIRSSIYDWADIIENELEIAQEIKRLGKEQSNVPDEAESEEEQKDKKAAIEDLTRQLPLEMRQIVRTEDDYDEEVADAITLLEDTLESFGFIEFRVFWDLDDSFEKEPKSLKVGDECYFSDGITTNRGTCILAYDQDGLSVGVVTNLFLIWRYQVFKNAMSKVFGPTPVLSRVSRTGDGNTADVQSFYLKVDESWILAKADTKSMEPDLKDF